MPSIEIFIRKIEKRLTGKISLAPKGEIRGRLLLSYITAPFLFEEENLPKTHTNLWECKEMAKIFLDRGYAVDVIDWNNDSFVPQKTYNVFIDIHTNMERLAKILSPKCKRIYHATGAHFKFQNEAEKKRLDDLKNRRGIILPKRRSVVPSKAIEYADICTYVGNNFTKETYSFARKPMVRIPISTTHVYQEIQRDHEKSRKCFLWLGGTGLVHKGLDLLLDAFRELPEYTLTIVGPIHKEKDFEEAFRKELYKTPNIHNVGWLDLGGEKFLEILKTHAWLIYPSCSEGGGGNVIVGMHGGLIPIVTREASVDIENFGILIDEASVPRIKNIVENCAYFSPEEIGKRSFDSLEFVRKNHTRENFSRNYKKFVDEIIER